MPSALGSHSTSLSCLMVSFEDRLSLHIVAVGC